MDAVLDEFISDRGYNTRARSAAITGYAHQTYAAMALRRKSKVPSARNARGWLNSPQYHSNELFHDGNTGGVACPALLRINQVRLNGSKQDAGTSRKVGAQIKKVEFVAIAPSNTLSGVGATGGTAGEKPAMAMPVYAYSEVFCLRRDQQL